MERRLSGLTWLDIDGDGSQDEGEEMLNGVQVALYWKGEDDAEGDYVPYCYPGTDTPVVIQTGQSVSVQAADSDAIKSDQEEGCYLFTDLPEGTFKVVFTSGTCDISDLLASPRDKTGDDTKDSDGDPTYNETKTKLVNTAIDSISMPAARSLTYHEYSSKHHDSGFYYRRYELPEAGGVGTTQFYIIGGLMTLAAAVLLATKRRMSKR